MREKVELLVNALGADAVEYKLRARTRTSSSWKPVAHGLWVVAGLCMATWRQQQRQQTWLLMVGALAALTGNVINAALGSTIVEESALVVPSMGVELSKRKRNGAVEKQFIPASDISAVVVNEGFVFSDVVYYLAFVVRDRDTMVVAFEHFRPRIAVLAEVYRQIKGSLFPGDAAMSIPQAHF